MFCDLAECEKDVSQVRIISKEIRRSSDGTHVIREQNWRENGQRQTREQNWRENGQRQKKKKRAKED